METVKYRDIIDEIVSETGKVYYDYPQLDVWEAIDIATRVVKYKYKEVEIIGD
jgi:hypothetical protein